MRQSFSLALAAAGLAASALPAAATTRLVPQQYPTIQSAVAAAQTGDTVLVSAKPRGGVYSEAVTITTPSVRLQGVGNPVIDGTAFNTLVHRYPNYPQYDYWTAPNGIDVQASHVTVAGLTVQNFGLQEAQNGIVPPGFAPSSGINSGLARQSSAPSDITVSGCTLKNNYAGVNLNGALYSATGFSFYPTGFSSGYRVLGCVATGNVASGVGITGDSVTVAAGAFAKNGGDGLDVFGEGLTVTGCDAGGNAGDGLNVFDYDTYNVPGSTPADEPAGPTTVALNAVHDNGYEGIQTDGTMSITGNAVLHNAEYGIYMSNDADGSTLSGNVISGTTYDPNAGSYDHPGTGLYVSETLYDPSNLTVSFNQISGNAGDGIYFEYVSGATIANNTVTGNAVAGIHLSDYTTADGYTPVTVTRNVALHNAQYDAFDDAAAPDTLTYADGSQDTGDGGYYGPTVNVWTHDLFGKTDPAGLGK